MKARAEGNIQGNVIVRKYGGTSVAQTALLQRIAQSALQAQDAGYQPVLVVSAMSGETNRLLALAQGLSPDPDPIETDSLASTGEQVAAALTAIAIRAAGGAARSFLGHQLPILTDANAGEARIHSIELGAVRASLERNEIPVIAGFQGVNAMERITTLGRGGSDTTAVAVAASLGGAACEIYTDVDGIYTADPNVCPDARKLNKISYAQMLRLAGLGAKVMHARSVALAEKYRLPIHLRSSFNDVPGTWIAHDLEAVEATCVACDKNLARVRVQVSGTAFETDPAALVERVCGTGIRIDAMSFAPATVTVVLRQTDAPRLIGLLQAMAQQQSALRWESEEGLARISLVGRLLQDPGTVAAASAFVRASGIPIDLIQTTESAISFWIAARHSDEAQRALHQGFSLEKETRP